MRTEKAPEDTMDITLCKTPVGQIIFILKRLLGSEMQKLTIEMPRTFLVNTSEYVRQKLIGKSVKISITTDDDVVLKNVILHISHGHSDYQKLWDKKFYKDLREFTTDTVEFDITINDMAIIGKLIESTRAYDLNVKTI